MAGKKALQQLQLEHGDVVEIKTAAAGKTNGGKNGAAKTIAPARARSGKLSLTKDGVLLIEPGDLTIAVKGFGTLPSAEQAKQMEAELDQMMTAFRQSQRRIRKAERESAKISAKTDAVLKRLREKLDVG